GRADRQVLEVVELAGDGGRELEGPEPHVVGVPGVAAEGERWVVVAGALLEARRVDRGVVPGALVGVGGHRLGAAAELLALVPLLLLLPLEHLDLALEGERVLADAEHGIAELLAGGGVAG